MGSCSKDWCIGFFILMILLAILSYGKLGGAFSIAKMVGRFLQSQSCDLTRQSFTSETQPTVSTATIWPGHDFVLWPYIRQWSLPDVCGSEFVKLECRIHTFPHRLLLACRSLLGRHSPCNFSISSYGAISISLPSTLQITHVSL